MTGPALLTIAEAAETLRCKKTRVYELLADGTLIRGPRYGRQTVILAESVYQALEKTYDPPAPPPRRRRRGARGQFAAACDELLKEVRSR